MKNYEDILKYVKSIGSNSINVFGGDFEGGYQLQQVPEEIAKLIFYFKQNNIEINNYCEIGAASHGLTRLMVDMFDIKSVITIDLGLDWVGKKRNIEAIKEKTIFHMVSGDSHSFPFLYFCDKPIFDFVIIDGDHSYEGVKKDYYDIYKCVKVGGYIMFHDTENIIGVDVNKFNEELKKENNKELILIAEYKETDKFKGISLWRKNFYI